MVHFHPPSHNPHIRAQHSKQKKTASFIKVSAWWRRALVPVQPRGWGLNRCPDPPLSLPSDSPTVVFPEVAQWRTLGNQAQLGRGGKDTGWDCSPFFALTLSTRLSLSFHLVWQVSLVRLSAESADSAGILARSPRCSLAISGPAYYYKGAEDTPIRHTADIAVSITAHYAPPRPPSPPRKPEAEPETLPSRGESRRSCLNNNLLHCVSPSLSMPLYIRTPSYLTWLHTAAVSPRFSLAAVPGQSVCWTAEGPRGVPLRR